MGDDKEQASGKLSTAKSGCANQKQKIATIDDKAANSQRRRRRRRRSLFSLLFTSGGSQADEGENRDSSEGERADLKQLDLSSCQDGSLKKRASKRRHPRARSNQDVVLIRPREAECAEATLVSLVNESHEADDEAEEAAAAAKLAKDTRVTTKDSEAKHSRALAKDNTGSDKNTLQSLVRRKMRRFKATKSKSHDEDADSYILDLNDCLDREKLRVSSSSSAASASSSSRSISPASLAADVHQERGPTVITTRAKEFSPVRETSPIDDKWHTNREYIPTVTTKQHELSGDKIVRRQPDTDKRRRQQTSPLLVEFLESHQIKLRGGRSKPASGDSLERTASPPTRSGSSAGSSSSSLDSGASPPSAGRARRRKKAASGPAPLPPVSYFDELRAGARAGTKLNELSESERRLFHWRKLAARSVTMWQVPDESSSDEESDDSDLGDFIDCQAPARVCYCSDDTSCSSVELIWSRPSGGPAQTAANPVIRLQRDTRSPAAPATRPLHPIATPTSAAPLSGRPSLSPHLQPAMSRPSSRSRSPTPQTGGLQVYSQQQVMRYTGSQMAAMSSNNNSLKSVGSGRSMCQRPAILELAKPSRARDRRIGGDRNNNNNNSDATRPERRTKEEKMAARRSMPAPPTPGQDCATATERTRDWSAVPVSRSASGSDWVPNPLFGRLAKSSGVENSTDASRPTTPARATLKSQKQAKSCDDSTTAERESAPAEVAGAGGTRLSLRRHLSVDLQQPTESEKIEAVSGPKSSRLRSFLARIKRQDTTTTQKDSSGLQRESDCDKNNSSQELEDEFNAADEAGAAFTDRARRHRWSLRMRSPFTTSQTHATGNENHAYLSHLVNARLDTKRIKSNVSSFKSQLGERLSDTGKRASVLADQLITSIKDTTKEQLLLATTGAPARDRYDTLPNSFASSPSPWASAASDPLLVQKLLLAKQDTQQDGLGTQQRKAKLFSLIYMHQQQQATAPGGRPVITRQPTSAAVGRARPLRPPPPPPPLIQTSLAACDKRPQVDQPQVDLDKLLDPRELLLDKFRAMERDLRAQGQTTGGGGEITSEYQRLSKTIAPRDRELANVAFKAAAESGPKRRASCTV